jgi:hypothetical protein
MILIVLLALGIVFYLVWRYLQTPEHGGSEGNDDFLAGSAYGGGGLGGF